MYGQGHRTKRGKTICGKFSGINFPQIEFPQLDGVSWDTCVRRETVRQKWNWFFLERFVKNILAFLYLTTETILARRFLLKACFLA
jgi:hypothetical protein